MTRVSIVSECRGYASSDWRIQSWEQGTIAPEGAIPVPQHPQTVDTVPDTEPNHRPASSLIRFEAVYTQ
jgi:hypothetical protein